MPKRSITKGGLTSQSSDNSAGIWNINERYHLEYQTGGGGSMTLLTPNVDGLTLAAGQDYDITWTTDTDPELLPVNTVRIEFSEFGGSNLTTIVEGLANTGSYTWTVPVMYTRLGVIRVANDDNVDQFPSVAASGFFTIIPSGWSPGTTTMIVNPPAPDVIVSGTITWAASDIGDMGDAGTYATVVLYSGVTQPEEYPNISGMISLSYVVT